MKFIILIITLNFLLITYSSASNDSCKKLVDKPIEWSKCIKDKSIKLGKEGSKKLNTDSKLTDWIKKKIGK